MNLLNIYNGLWKYFDLNTLLVEVGLLFKVINLKTNQWRVGNIVSSISCLGNQLIIIAILLHLNNQTVSKKKILMAKETTVYIK